MMNNIFGRYFHFLILIQCLMKGIVCPKANPRVNILNVSKETPNPYAFWPFHMSQHNVSTLSQLQSTEHAILYDAPLITSDPTALHPVIGLQGTATSRVEIPNTSGTMDGVLAMTWIFYIYPQQSQSAVLLHYRGVHPGGFQIRYLASGNIQVKMHDINGQPSIYDSTFTVKTGEWTLVGITYNHLWNIQETDNMDIFTITSKGSLTADGFIVDSAMISGTANGDISLGSTADGTESFYGNIYCVQFYPTSLIGGTRTDTPDVCDPNLMSFTGNPSVDYVYYESLIGTTTAITTEASTLQDTTTTLSDETTVSQSETTTSQSETTTSQSETTTSLPVTTTSQSLTETTTAPLISGSTAPSTSGSTTPPTLTTNQVKSYQDTCSRFEKAYTGTTIQLPLATVSTDKPVICAKQCQSMTDCSIFAIDVLAGVCLLGSSNTALVSSTQYTIFAKR